MRGLNHSRQSLRVSGQVGGAVRRPERLVEGWREGGGEGRERRAVQQGITGLGTAVVPTTDVAMHTARDGWESEPGWGDWGGR